MEWAPLSIESADAVIAEARQVVSALEKLDRQLRSGQRTKSTAAAIDSLVAAINERLVSLDGFYHTNDLDPRAAQFEMCRIMLKRALTKFTMNRADAVSAGSPAPTTAPAPAPVPLPVAPRPRSSTGTSQDTQAPRSRTSSFQSPAAASTVTLKVILSRREYEEILARRAAAASAMR